MLRALVLLLVALVLPACATLTTGTTQEISVVTEPAGAACALERSGGVIGVVDPTPGRVQVDKSSREITVSCTLAGHARGVARLEANFQPMALGNILVGGIVGTIVDASTGARSYYPSEAMLTLVPEAAGGTGTAPPGGGPEAARVSAIRREMAERIATARRDCADLACVERVVALERERDTEVAAAQAFARAGQRTN